MKADQLRVKTVDELRQVRLELLEKQFKLRMKRSSGQLTKTHEIGLVRRDIARVNTVLNDKRGN